MNWAQQKLIERGANTLTDGDLLDLVTGVDGVGDDIIDVFGGFRGMANQPLSKFIRFKGLGYARIIRIAACFEVAKRVVEDIERNE